MNDPKTIIYLDVLGYVSSRSRSVEESCAEVIFKLAEKEIGLARQRSCLELLSIQWKTKSFEAGVRREKNQDV